MGAHRRRCSSAIPRANRRNNGAVFGMGSRQPILPPKLRRTKGRQTPARHLGQFRQIGIARALIERLMERNIGRAIARHIMRQNKPRHRLMPRFQFGFFLAR